MESLVFHVDLDPRTVRADQARERVLRVLAATGTDNPAFAAEELAHVVVEILDQRSPEALVADLAHLVRAFATVAVGLLELSRLRTGYDDAGLLTVLDSLFTEEREAADE